MLIFVLAMCLAVVAHRYLQSYAPSNALIARVRRDRPRLRIAAGPLLLSAALASCSLLLADRAATGGSGWLNLIVLIAIWDAMKFAWMGVLVAILLVVQSQERARQRDSESRASE